MKMREMLGDSATQISKLAPEIETRLGPFPERHRFAPHEERLLFFDAVAQVFSHAARNRHCFSMLTIYTGPTAARSG